MVANCNFFPSSLILVVLLLGNKVLTRISQFLLLLVCLTLVGCGNADDVTREGPRTAEDEAAIEAMDADIDAEESGGQ